MSASESPSELRLTAVLLPIVEGWRTLAVVALIAGAATAAYVGTRPREYRAAVTLSAVSSNRAGLAGSVPGIGQLLGAAGGNGLQATPQFVRMLTQQEGVLERLAATPVAAGSRRRIIDSLGAVMGGPIDEREATIMLRRLFKTEMDKETGIITISARLTDSALARRSVDVLVEEVSTTFTRVARAQAVELRDALNARVDSAQGQLTRAENALQDFTSANRAFQDYSAAALQQQRLERRLSLAQAVFQQAVTERESSVGKALEETPAVVVVDSVPRLVPRVARGTALKAVGVALFASLLAMLVLVARASAMGLPNDRALERERWRRALRSIPLFGWVLVRMFMPTPPGAAPGTRADGDGTPLRVA
jgi:uncharacterized protein involved in exopolysaccharide biosynthesis